MRKVLHTSHLTFLARQVKQPSRDLALGMYGAVQKMQMSCDCHAIPTLGLTDYVKLQIGRSQTEG